MLTKAFIKSKITLHFSILSTQCRPLSTVSEESSSKPAPEKKKRGKENFEEEEITTFFEAVRKIQKEKPSFSPEELVEHAKIGKEYQIQSMRRHNKFTKDLTTKIYLQQDALTSLPEYLRVEAKIVDETPPPLNRPKPYFDTPPIKDFETKYGELHQGPILDY